MKSKKKSIRKIIVNDVEYYWVVNNHNCDGDGGNSFKIWKDKVVIYDTLIHSPTVITPKIVRNKIIELETIKFDLDRDDFYEYDKPRKPTRDRLFEIGMLGLDEVGIAQFGIRGKMSGLYIEKIWSLNEKDWTDYVNWIKTFEDE